jgi:hypothetical protein
MIPNAALDVPILNNPAARKAGILLMAATVLEIAAMAHHPTVASHDIGPALEQIARMSDLSAWVHGLLIALMLVIFYIFTEFARRRGVALPWVRAGLIAYSVGVLAMIGAALMSGFVITQVASMAAHVPEPDLRSSAQLINFCAVLNQTFANLGAVLMSLGIVCWSIDLVRSRGFARVVGIFGLLIGLVPAAALVFGALHLNVTGMTQVVLLQSVWYIGIGALLIRGEV